MTSRRRPAPPQNRPASQQQRYNHFTAMQHRSAAKQFCTPVSECGCIVDPDFDKHRCGTEVEADAIVAAALHLRAVGAPGLFGTNECRAMWREGHHRLAAECFSYAHGEAA